MSKPTVSANGGAMSPAEARHFLHHCTEEIEAGMTPALARRIREAHAIVEGEPARRLTIPAPIGESFEAELCRLLEERS